MIASIVNRPAWQPGLAVRGVHRRRRREIQIADASGKLLEQFHAFVDRNDHQRGRQRIGRSAASSHDADGSSCVSTGDPVRGSRISPFCCDVDIDVSRSSRTVRAPTVTGHPLRAGWSADGRDRASSGVDQRVPDAFRLEHRDRAVDRVPFADAAEIELDAVGAEANAIGRARPRSSRSRRTSPCRGNLRLVTRPAPLRRCASFHVLQQRRDRHVEPAARKAGKPRATLR